jgi:RNA polymerase sigma-70 factor, ECF subfamily
MQGRGSSSEGPDLSSEGAPDARSEKRSAQVAVRPSARDATLEGRIYDEHFDFTWRSLRRLGVPESALDDAVQEVFLVVYRRLPEFEGRAKLSTWIFRTAMNVALHARRNVARSRLDFPEDLPDEAASGPSPEEHVAQASEARLVRQLLGKLSLDERAVLILAEFEDQSPAEIAETLGVPRNTVYSRLRAARIKFAEHYERATCSIRNKGRHE